MNKTSACVNCFKSLGVKTKLDIYNFLLDHKTATVTQLVELVKVSQPTVSYHLHDMAKNGLLKSKKEGKEVYYEVNNTCPNYNCECILHGIKFEVSEDINVGSNIKH